MDGDRIVAVLVLLALSGHCSGQRCPTDWMDGPLKTNCYYFGVGVPRKTWFAAREHCQSFQADLVKIDDVLEKNWLLEKIKQLSSTYPGEQEFWVGLTNTGENETVWSWPDGTSLPDNLLRWGSGEPSDPVTERCAEIWDNLLNDKSCLTPIEYVCERSKLIPLTCDVDNGWQHYAGSCYKYIPAFRPYNQARQSCMDMDANLATVTNDAEQNAVNHMATRVTSAQNAWIGLHRNKNTWVLTNNTQLSPASMQYWQRAPNVGTDTPLCVAVNATAKGTNSWYAVSCDQGLSYICRKPEGVCPSGFDQHQSRCYLPVFNPDTWYSASAYCDRLVSGGRLLDIRSSTESTFLISYLRQQKKRGMARVWTGLSRRNVQSLQADQPMWTWTPNQPDQLTYFNWAPGASSRISSADRSCVFIYTDDSNGKWRSDLDCNEIIPFVCVTSVGTSQLTTTTTTTTTTTPRPKVTIPTPRPVSPMRTPATTTSTTMAPTTLPTDPPVTWSAKCGPFYEESYYSGLCYQFNDEKRTWIEAENHCKASGGHLASIQGTHEQFYIGGRIRSMRSSNLWISANSRNDQGGWEWADGTPFRFVNWEPGQPDSIDSTEECVSLIVRTSRWADNSCNQRNGFICKKHGIAPTTDLPKSPTMGPKPGADQYYGCPDGWKSYRNSCFMVKRTRNPWLGAQKDCRLMGGDLATIDNEDEQNFLVSQLPKSHCYNMYHNDTQCDQWAASGECIANPRWMATHCHLSCKICIQDCKDIYNTVECARWARIGECDTNHDWMLSQCPLSCGICDSVVYGGFWIGLNDRSDHMTFRWSDDSPVKYTTWAEKEPNNYGRRREECVSMYLQDGKWNDAQCENALPGYICRKPKTLLPKTTPSPLGVGCINESIGYSAYCYLMSNDKLTWRDAEDRCQQDGGYLATVNDRYVQSFIASQIVDMMGPFWIGLSDQDNPGTFVSWTSGSQLTFTHWGKDQTSDEDAACVAMTTKHPVGMWLKANCTTESPFICEYPRTGYTTTTSTTVSTTTVEPPTCAEGWLNFTDNCYKLFSGNDKLPWLQARAKCRQYGGDLVSVHGLGEEDFIFGTVMIRWMSIWAGLNDRDYENGFSWSDGTPLDYTNWYTGEPNDAMHHEDCVEMPGWLRQWNDYNCYIAKDFICKIKKGFPVIDVENHTDTYTTETCGKDGDWLFHNGFCYYHHIRVSEPVTWYEARNACLSNNSYLVSIHSQDESNFLASIISMASDSGLQWIGLNELQLKGYEWTDGTPLEYIHWNANEPSDDKGGERCVGINDGRWMDTNCNLKLIGYVCKRPNNTAAFATPRPPPLPIPGAGCPPDFIPSDISEKCYYISTSADGIHHYEHAKMECEKKYTGTQLTSINSAEEQAFLLGHLGRREHRGSRYYIGFSDLLRYDGQYAWNDNSEVTYTNWNIGEPSTASENCVELINDGNNAGTWNDIQCWKQLRFICQTKKSLHFPTPSPVPQDDCPLGYTRSFDSCYMFDSSPMTWESARTTCKIDSADLVSLSSVYEQAFIEVFTNKLKSTPFWIGLKRSEVSEDMVWADGWPLEFTKWADGQPSLEPLKKCAVSQNNQWKTSTCDLEMPFLCEKSLVLPPTTPLPGICPSSAMHLHMHMCYFVEVDTPLPWLSARDACVEKGMNLVSFENLDELNYVKSLVEDESSGTSQKVWIGYSRLPADGDRRKRDSDYYGYDYDHSSHYDFTEDLRSPDQAVEFRWEDGTPKGFENWNDNEPSSAWNNEAEQCVEMYTSGRWNDLNCKAYNRAYVCKGPSQLLTTSAQPKTRETTTEEQETTASVIENTEQSSTSTMEVSTSSKSNPMYHIPRRTNPLPHKETKTGLSAGEIIGIVIGVIGLILMGVAAYFTTKQLMSATYNTKGWAFTNALYRRSADSVSMTDDNSPSGSTIKLCTLKK